MENVSTENASAKAVRVVSKDGCKFCVKAKDFLKAQGIPFFVEKLGECHRSYSDVLIGAPRS